MRAEINWSSPEGDPDPLDPVADPLCWANPRPPKLPHAVNNLASRDADRVDRWRERNSRSRIASAFRDSPCWLASVVFHALVMVILGSLAGKQIRAARDPITLTMTTTEHDGQELAFTAPAYDSSEQDEQDSEQANERASDPIFSEPDPAPAAAENEDDLFEGITEFVEQTTETATVSFEASDTPDQDPFEVTDTSVTPFAESPFSDPQGEPAPYGLSLIHI